MKLDNSNANALAGCVLFHLFRFDMNIFNKLFNILNQIIAVLFDFKYVKNFDVF